MQNKKIINLTPHEVVIFAPEGEVHIPRSDSVARVSQNPSRIIAQIGSDGEGIPIPISGPPEFGAIEWGDFDTEKYDSVIVSMLVGQALKSLPKDELPPFAVFAPNSATDSAVRDEEGQLLGVRSLTVYYAGPGSDVANPEVALLKGSDK